MPALGLAPVLPDCRVLLRAPKLPPNLVVDGRSWHLVRSCLLHISCDTCVRKECYIITGESESELWLWCVGAVPLPGDFSESGRKKDHDPTPLDRHQADSLYPASFFSFSCLFTSVNITLGCLSRCKAIFLLHPLMMTNGTDHPG